MANSITDVFTAIQNGVTALNNFGKQMNGSLLNISGQLANRVISIAGNHGTFTLNATTGITNTVNDIELIQASSSQFGAVKVDGSTIGAVSGVVSVNVAVETDQEAAASVVLTVTPGRQQFHPSASKAWVKFTGSGTNGAQTITASYNVSGVSRTGAGSYTVTFSVPFSSANYAVSAIQNANAAVNGFVQLTSTATILAGSCAFTFVNISGPSVFDPASGAMAMFFGDQ